LSAGDALSATLAALEQKRPEVDFPQVMIFFCLVIRGTRGMELAFPQPSLDGSLSVHNRPGMKRSNNKTETHETADRPGVGDS
jgi:hypothetical protein